MVWVRRSELGTDAVASSVNRAGWACSRVWRHGDGFQTDWEMPSIPNCELENAGIPATSRHCYVVRERLLLEIVLTRLFSLLYFRPTFSSLFQLGIGLGAAVAAFRPELTHENRLG